jgi:undecaprenyl-diphosphatase
MRATLQSWDESASRGIVAAAAGQPWRGLARLISLSGTGWLWLALGLGLLATGRWPGMLLLLAVAVSFVLTQLLKATFRRPRPTARRLTFASDRFAFPSGHAVRVGAIACSLTLSDPAQGVYWLAWALLVALARVARARHYLLDVSGGLLLGALLGPLVLALVSR